jgi:hypothetical protein
VAHCTCTHANSPMLLPRLTHCLVPTPLLPCNQPLATNSLRRGRCSRGDACKYSHNANLLTGFPALNPGLLPGAFGSPGMLMDPSLAAAAAWGPLGPLNPQTAAAAAAAAAAYAAAGPPGSNFGNVVNRLGVLGLGGPDPAAAAAAAALASQAGPLGGMPAATGGLAPLGGARPPLDANR